MISGFRREVDEIGVFLVYYMAVILYPRFRTNCRSRIHESRSPLKFLEDGQIGFPETSIINYHHTLRNIPEGRRLQFQQHVSITLILRVLMSYIYGVHILDVSRSHTTTQHSR
jgi:hypothetical protein